MSYPPQVTLNNANFVEVFISRMEKFASGEIVRTIWKASKLTLNKGPFTYGTENFGYFHTA